MVLEYGSIERIVLAISNIIIKLLATFAMLVLKLWGLYSINYHKI